MSGGFSVGILRKTLECFRNIQECMVNLYLDLPVWVPGVFSFFEVWIGCPIGRCWYRICSPFSYFPKITHLKFNSSLKSYGIPKEAGQRLRRFLPSWLFLGRALANFGGVFFKESSGFSSNECLVGGFNSFEPWKKPCCLGYIGDYITQFHRNYTTLLTHQYLKNISQIWIISPRIEVKIEKCLKPPPYRLRVANSAPKQRQDLQNHNIWHWLKRCKRKPETTPWCISRKKRIPNW